ncbi:MAG: hypothetical protein Q9227_007191 [Pyrenula ochraceoflavens]
MSPLFTVLFLLGCAFTINTATLDQPEFPSASANGMSSIINYQALPSEPAAKVASSKNQDACPVVTGNHRPDRATIMKLNISYPANGTQKLFEIEDDRKLRVFMEKRMGNEVLGDSVGDEWKGYIFRITGGNDKQGFPMKQGVMLPTRVRLLLSDGHSCYRPRRDGERKRKSVRGCIVGSDLSVLALSIVKQGDGDIPGLTDTVNPKRLGPKRATKIRKFFGLSKEDDVRKFVIRREVTPKGEGKKPYTKAPKIQRLVTPQRIQHKRHRIALKRRKSEAQKDAANEYAQMLAKRVHEEREKRSEMRKRRASSMRK